jgi:YegS/Rv2252/BmrU family lipid kinase
VNPPITVILNPNAGRGVALRLWKRIGPLLRSRHPEAEVLMTGGPGDATRLSANCRSPLVAVIGGDGTINEAANGLAGTDRTMAVIAAGSGNDFVKGAGIPFEPEPALALLTDHRVRMVDAAEVRTGDGRTERKRLFVNGVGVGFDAAVARRVNRTRRLGGTMVYVLSVFRTLGSYRAPMFVVETDGRRLEQQCLLIAAGNGPCAGGGFYLTPQAVVDDGLLDLCVVSERGVTGILRLMPSVMRGKHTHAAGVTMERGRSVSIRGDIPFHVHADGEIVGEEVTEVDLAIRERVLRVAVPRSGS